MNCVPSNILIRLVHVFAFLVEICCWLGREEREWNKSGPYVCLAYTTKRTGPYLGKRPLSENRISHLGDDISTDAYEVLYQYRMLWWDHSHQVSVQRTGNATFHNFYLFSVETAFINIYSWVISQIIVFTFA